MPTPDQRLVRLEAENTRLRQAHDSALAQSQRLAAELADVQKVPVPPSTPSKSSATRAELLRGLQQSHDALGRDMSDQLRKLDAQPLTPSRRHNSSLSNGTMSSPDLLATKRIRSLETEINGLRQQLDDERDEKDFLLERVKDLERGSTTDGKTPVNCESARPKAHQNADTACSRAGHVFAFQTQGKVAAVAVGPVSGLRSSGPGAWIDQMIAGLRWRT